MKNGRPRSAFATNTGAKNVHHCRRRLCHLLLLSPNNDEEEAHPTGSIPNQNRNRCVRRSLQSERTDSTAQVPCAAGRRPRMDVAVDAAAELLLAAAFFVVGSFFLLVPLCWELLLLLL